METGEIKTISDVVHLVVSGDDLSQYGHVYQKTRGDLTLLNYSQAAQFEGRWNYLERVSRGLIINHVTGEVVARPFDKFFNWGECGLYGSGHVVNVAEKMDGSLGILYRDNGRYRVATRGSFDSEQAEWATDYLNRMYDISDLHESVTMLFEIIYPDNRIVIDYGKREDLVLLAIRSRANGRYVDHSVVKEFAGEFGFNTPDYLYVDSVETVAKMTADIDANHEGWVVEMSDGSRWKFKGEQYKQLHKMIAGLSFKNTLEACRDGLVDTVRDTIPDEFLGDFECWVSDIRETVSNTKQLVNMVYRQAPKGDRKTFALWATGEHKELAPYLFALLDDRDIEPIIYRAAFLDK